MSLINKVSRFHRVLKEKRYIQNVRKMLKKKINHSRRRKIIDTVFLTKEQECQIKEYFQQNIGERIDVNWHKYYQGVSGKFAIDYMPETYYRLYEYFVNSKKYGEAFTDKINQYIVLNTIPGIRTAELYLFSRKGTWYDGSFNNVSIQKAVEIVKKASKCFYKPINDTNSGVGCGIFSVENKTDEEIKIFLNSCNNVMLQSIIKNRADTAELHPSSLNTFRIMTYKLDGKVYATPALLRIGIGGNHIDNAHAGGIFVGVGSDGTLKSCAHTEFGDNYEKHPSTQVVFGGRHIDRFPELLEALKRAHNHFQHLDIISWDAVIDPEDNFVVVEFNLFGQSPWLVQMANGCGVFEENTAKILKKLKMFMS